MKINRFVFLVIITVASTSCDTNEDVPTVTINDLVGSWNATSSVYTDKSNINDAVDLIAMGGEIRFTMLEDGRVRTWFTLDTISDEWDSQAKLINSNTLIINPAEAVRGIDTVDFVLDNNTLELTNKNTGFDFTLSGATEVPASSVTIFERN